MAIVVLGQSLCGICGLPIHEEQDVIGFPAFLPDGHALSRFADAAFHRSCLAATVEGQAVERLYERYLQIWESRPVHFRTLREMEEWGRKAFREFQGLQEE